MASVVVAVACKDASVGMLILILLEFYPGFVNSIRTITAPTDVAMATVTATTAAVVSAAIAVAAALVFLFL